MKFGFWFYKEWLDKRDITYFGDKDPDPLKYTEVKAYVETIEHENECLVELVRNLRARTEQYAQRIDKLTTEMKYAKYNHNEGIGF